MKKSKETFDYETKRWGSVPIDNLYTNLQGLELAFFDKYVGPKFKNGSTSLLDVGCGGGNIPDYLKRKYDGWNVYGVDVSERSLKFARMEYKNVKFQKAYSYKLPFKDESFDILTNFDSLEHFENLDKSLSEARRVLKRDGVYCLGVPLELQFPSLFWLLHKVKWLNKSLFSGHINFFNDKSLVDAMNKHGFMLVKRNFSYHYFLSIFDTAYYLFQAIKGEKIEALETSMVSNETLWKKMLFTLKNFVSAVSYLESSLLFWFPGGKGHYVFKIKDKDFFSDNPPVTMLEDVQIKYGLEKVIRPKDLGISARLERLGFSKAKTVLDFGCANGIWLERLIAKKNKKGIGVDVAGKLIHEAQKRRGRKGVYYNSSGKWPLKDGSVDFCVSFDVFEHIEDKDGELKKIYKTMSPGGKFLFYALNKNHKFTFDWLFFDVCGSGLLYERANHKLKNFPDPSVFARRLGKHGFKGIGCELYQGPANLIWDTFCYTYLYFIEKSLRKLGMERLLRPIVFVNDVVVRAIYPLNNLIDSLFFKTGNSNGFFIWGQK